MKKIGYFLGLFILIGMLPVVQESEGKIPEPDNIIYGTVIQGGQILSSGDVHLKVNDRELASFSIDPQSGAGSHYILRTPIDALSPRAENTAKPGDVAKIYVGQELAAVTTISERGTVQMIRLNMDDTDHDSMPDGFEQLIVDADPNDALRTIGDVLPDGDYDGDGISNLEEFINETDPTEIDNALQNLRYAIISLQLLAGIADENALMLPKLENDIKIGIEEAIFFLMTASFGK